MKLNFGCGRDYKNGWINIDNNIDFKADKYVDVFKFPLPFKDGSVGEIYASHVIEHCPRHVGLTKLFEELYRICREGAVITIKVPHVSDFGAFADSTHHYYFKSDTLNYIFTTSFTGEKPVSRFEFVSSKITVALYHWRFLNVLNPFVNRFKWFSEKFLGKYIPFEEITWVLRVKKGEPLRSSPKINDDHAGVCNVA
ncbi:MAG TPA: hypothetical protein VI979_00890 [archaeon]|nr:hypothetical protein [archaeon]